MKKIYAFLAAALMSVSVFASADVVPSDAVLADYYDQGNVCVCIYVPGDMACNDIVLAGSFHKEGTSWITSPVSDLPHFEPVEGYDGWYVASFEPEAEPDAEKGMQAKPVMLDVDGNFNWEYQVHDVTLIRGGVQVVDGFSGEIDLINYGADAPNVFKVDAWKSNPCTAIYHNYTITVVSNGCGGYVVPFINGAMYNWDGFHQMQYNSAKTAANEGIPTYDISFKAAEGTPYQIASGMMDSEGVIPTEGDSAAGWKDIAYIQVLVDGAWTRYNPDNSFTGAEADIVYDLRVDTLQWARCDDSPLITYNVSAKMPAENCPEAVEIIGGFDGWEGTAMTFNASTGYFEAAVEAKAANFFKFRSAGSWDQELEIYNAADDEWAKIGDNEYVFGQLADDQNAVVLDFSTIGRWTVKEGIEEIVLTEKAQKVVVDGVLYIVRDNKMYNVQGTQVR